MLQRFEVNVRTGERTVIDQKAYKNDADEVLVLDAGESAPEGFKEFTPVVDEES